MTSSEFEVCYVITSNLIGRGRWPVSGSDDEDEGVVADEGDEQEDEDSHQDSGLAKDEWNTWQERISKINKIKNM